MAALGDASFAYSSLSGWEEQGRLPGFLDLTRQCWRTRGYGDFWPYMMVAEGSLDLCAEPELNLWDMAAIAVVVQEAGGRFTSLDGVEGVHGGNAAASNGLLHEEMLDVCARAPEPYGSCTRTTGCALLMTLRTHGNLRLLRLCACEDLL